jgi:pyruvate,water dikinase
VRPLLVPLADATDAARFGPKAATLAMLRRAGLPVPDGCCVDAQVYRDQLGALALGETARRVFSAEPAQARRAALELKLALMERPLAPRVGGALLEAWRAVARPAVVRSSALVEDRAGASFAGQFQSYLGLDTEEEFLTAARGCWAALWAPRALRYMAAQGLDPVDTSMALLIQPLVAACAAGGGLSQTAQGEMVVNAAPGLGASVAQGEAVPERYVLERNGRVMESAAGAKYHAVGCVHGRRALRKTLASAPCLQPAHLAQLALLMRACEEAVGCPVEIEWALDASGLKLLQARPLRVAPETVPDESWLKRPRLRGHPSGIGRASGHARVVSCECELERVAPGEVLVTAAAGPALGEVLARVAGVVTELGGSTSHLASLARERGVPMVLGAAEATRRIPDGALVAVDGVAGIVRWAA